VGSPVNDIFVGEIKYPGVQSSLVFVIARILSDMLLYIYCPAQDFFYGNNNDVK